MANWYFFLGSLLYLLQLSSHPFSALLSKQLWWWPLLELFLWLLVHLCLLQKLMIRLLFRKETRFKINIEKSVRSLLLPVGVSTSVLSERLVVVTSVPRVTSPSPSDEVLSLLEVLVAVIGELEVIKLVSVDLSVFSVVAVSPFWVVIKDVASLVFSKKIILSDRKQLTYLRLNKIEIDFW